MVNRGKNANLEVKEINEVIVKSYDYVTKCDGEVTKGSKDIQYSNKEAAIDLLSDLKLQLLSQVKGGCHSCFDCANAYPNKCPKINDTEKKSIEEYDFIKRGYQLIRTNLTTEVGPKDKLEAFIVSSCDNFERDQMKRVTGADMKRARAARESLYTYFYDTASYDEALLLEYELANQPDDSNRKIVGSNPVAGSKVVDLKVRKRQREIKERRGR